jgi:hypothetical protein
MTEFSCFSTGGTVVKIALNKALRVLAKISQAIVLLENIADKLSTLITL